MDMVEGSEMGVEVVRAMDVVGVGITPPVESYVPGRQRQCSTDRESNRRCSGTPSWLLGDRSPIEASRLGGRSGP